MCLFAFTKLRRYMVIDSKFSLLCINAFVPLLLDVEFDFDLGPFSRSRSCSLAVSYGDPKAKRIRMHIHLWSLIFEKTHFDLFIMHEKKMSQKALKKREKTNNQTNDIDFDLNSITQK